MTKRNNPFGGPIATSNKVNIQEMKRDILTKIHESRINNPLRNLKNFPAVVLNTSTYNDPDAGAVATDVTGIYLTCVVRPLIHNWLIPFPCMPEYRGKQSMINWIISMHPTARSTDTVAMGRAINITPGTELLCYKVFDKNNNVSWRFDFTKISAPSGNYNFECLQSDGNKFSNGSLLASGGGAGKELSEPTFSGNTKPKRKWVATNSKKEDGTFAKGKCPRALTNKQASLPRNTTTFYYYTKPQIRALIKASGAPVHVKRTMWCFTSKEQPFKNRGGQAMYPNNNPAGIQTDGGRPNGSSYIKYQTCFKDAKTWRAFAGYESVEDGFKGFQAMIEAKYRSTKARWKKPSGTIQQQAETLTENYYKSWNTRATDAEIQTLRVNNSFTRRGSKYGNWKGTVAQFKNSLTELG